MQELDVGAANELIEKIVIHNPEKIGGRKHVTIEIYFTYVRKDSDLPKNFIYFLMSLRLKRTLFFISIKK